MIPARVDQLFLSNAGFVVLLKGQDDERSLPIFIGAVEAQSIAIWLNKIEIPRPLTHDLLKNILDRLECRLQRIEVCDLKEGTFYARLVMDTGDGEVAMDARPSDAIALALRVGARILVDESVMDRAGRVFDDDETEQSIAEVPLGDPLTNGDGTGGTGPALTPLEILERDLEKAVADERYEDAARLRDEILQIKSSQTGN
jgi:uncharacterized protein